jgi:4'-phosphopantetheinyl transferase
MYSSHGAPLVISGSHDILLFAFNLSLFKSRSAADLLVLSRDEKQRASQFRLAESRNRYVFRRSLLRRLLTRFVDTEASKIRFTKDRFGKPALAGSLSEPALHFNTSSTLGFYLVGVRRGGPIGVDAIQEPVEDELAPRVLSGNELERWESCGADARRTALQRAWARKEALLKASGHGLQIEPSSLDVGLDHRGGSLSLSLALNGTGPRPWTLLDIRWNHACVGAVCVPGIGELRQWERGWQEIPPELSIAGSTVSFSRISWNPTDS